MPTVQPNPDNEPTLAEVRRVQLWAVVMGALERRAKRAKAAATAQLDRWGALDEGDKALVRHPDQRERPLGTVYRTAPESRTYVSSAPDLAAWLEQHYPDRVKRVERLDVEEHYDELLDLAQKHAPDLVETVTVVEPWAEVELVRRSSELGAVIGPKGEADVPGIIVERKPGVLTVRPADDVDDALAELVRRVDLTAGALRPAELEGGEAA